MAKHQFEPGNQYGKGRPKGSGYVEECQRWAEAGGWTRLFGWADGKSGAAKNMKLQFEALRLILAYGYGKPKEITESKINGLGDLAEQLKAARLRVQRMHEEEKT